MNHRRTSVWGWQGAWLALLWLVACTSAQAQTPAQAAFNGFEGSVVRFASVEEGRRVLMANDDYIAATSDFQRSAFMRKEPPTTLEEFLAFHHGVVMPWPAKSEAYWRATLARLAPIFNALKLRLPKEVLLVNSDGRESDDAPYTRAHAVVLPGGGVGASWRHSEDELLAHELFHVVSRHDPALATRLYATLGFEPAAPLQWPPQWLPLRIANPDAPHHRHLMRTHIEGRDVALMPLLVATRPQLDRNKRETLQTVLDLRLLEVLPGRPGVPTTAILRNGEVAWHSLDSSVRDYLARQGDNTTYMHHPEETMADNIAFLVSGRKVSNPALLQRIKAVLLGESAP